MIRLLVVVLYYHTAIGAALEVRVYETTTTTTLINTEVVFSLSGGAYLHYPCTYYIIRPTRPRPVKTCNKLSWYIFGSMMRRHTRRRSIGLVVGTTTVRVCLLLALAPREKTTG